MTYHIHGNTYECTRTYPVILKPNLYKENNIYKGTRNYEKMGMNNMQFASFRDNVFLPFKDKTFYRVGREKDPKPDEWWDLSNVSFISYEDFEDYIVV